MKSAAVALLLAACATQAPPEPLAAPSPAVSAACHVVGPLPDPTCSPGDVETTDLDVICNHSTRERRAVPFAVHRQVFLEYGLAPREPSGAYEVDHIISLELGGSNDIKNLYPEAAEPRPGFHEKDLLEGFLHRKVCSGEMSIEDAQRAIATDWVAAYSEMSKR